MSFFFSSVSSSVSFTLKRLTGVKFKVGKSNFVIKNGKIYLGKHSVKVSPSTNKKFPGSKGYFTFTTKGWTYYILFSPSGIKVSAVHGKKVLTSSVKTPKGAILRPVAPAVTTSKGMYVYKELEVPSLILSQFG